MLSLATIEMLKALIAALLVYFPTVAISGYCEAWMARRLGDNSVAVAEFITLNPFVHTDPIGLASILLALGLDIKFIFGFGRYIPVNLASFTPPYRFGKLCAVLMARPLANLVLLLATVVAFVSLWGGFLSALHVPTSPLMAAVRMVLQTMIALNMISLTIYTIVACFRLLWLYAMPNLVITNWQIWALLLLLSILMFIVLAPFISFFVGFLMMQVEKFFAI